MSRKEAGVSRNPWFNKYSGIAGVEEVDDDDEEVDDDEEEEVCGCTCCCCNTTICCTNEFAGGETRSTKKSFSM
jgi:hypothetical protein